ncbi:MAG TPA: glycerate kinase [Candidatus Dormibacteraeota bacterium]|jgi:hydroxypyruvate reductase|nr:glycerate kinase [Candidatus Dormibacteraeota bacterium]
MRVRARLNSDKTLDKLHRDVLHAMNKALDAADPRNIIKQHLRVDRGILRLDDATYSLKHFRRLFLIGGGKASGRMAEEVEKLLGPRLSGGLLIVPDYLRPWPKAHKIKFRLGTHPIPSRQNANAVSEMLDLVENPKRDDLIIVVLSGGASALLELPAAGISMEDEGKITSLLLKSGANIQEMNTVRRHLSRVKGGRLAELLHPAHVLTLIISDVIGDQLDAIGSGPTVADPTTYSDAKHVLTKYKLWSRIPQRVRRLIEEGLGGALADTPKPRDKSFQRVKNVIVGSNRQSCQAAVAHLRKAGYHAGVLSTHLVGEAREVGRILGSISTDLRDSQALLSPPAALVSGGETTVTVAGSGKGGRNQELALAAASAIEGTDHLVVGTLATDGVDGPTDAAGALVDGTTVGRGRSLGMDPEKFLANNDSYSYFLKLDDLVKTGPTGTNVNDITLILAG